MGVLSRFGAKVRKIGSGILTRLGSEAKSQAAQFLDKNRDTLNELKAQAIDSGKQIVKEKGKGLLASLISKLKNKNISWDSIPKPIQDSIVKLTSPEFLTGVGISLIK